jgi:hypothetical protein
MSSREISGIGFGARLTNGKKTILASLVSFAEAIQNIRYYKK